MSTLEHTIQLPDYTGLGLKENLQKAKVEIDALAITEKMTSEKLWEVAALASAATPTAGGDRTKQIGGSTICSTIEEYAKKSGWIKAGRSLSALQSMIATYRKWKDVGRVPGCGFWTHHEMRNKQSELLPDTSFPEARAGKSEEAAAQIVRSALSVVPPKVGVSEAAKYLDTDKAEEVLLEDEAAADHVAGALNRSLSNITRGKSKKVKGDTLGLGAMVVILNLSGACAEFRQLAADQPESALVATGLDLLHETIRMAKGEEVSPEVANQTLEDLEEYLKRVSSD